MKTGERLMTSDNFEFLIMNVELTDR